MLNVAVSFTLHLFCLNIRTASPTTLYLSTIQLHLMRTILALTFLASSSIIPASSTRNIDFETLGYGDNYLKLVRLYLNAMDEADEFDADYRRALSQEMAKEAARMKNDNTKTIAFVDHMTEKLTNSSNRRDKRMLRMIKFDFDY